MKKKILSVLLALVMVVGMLPFGAIPAFAETEPLKTTEITSNYTVSDTTYYDAYNGRVFTIETNSAATVTFNNVTFRDINNDSGTDGNCVYIDHNADNDATLTVNFINCRFIGCGTENYYDGGAIYITGDGATQVNFYNCAALRCKADNGGFLYCTNPNAQINGHDSTVLWGCLAECDGGAVYLWNAVGIDGFTFMENNAGDEGGAVYNQCNSGSYGSMTNCRFYYNKALYGGAVWIKGDMESRPNYSDNIFYNNLALDGTKDIYLYYAITLKNLTFYSDNQTAETYTEHISGDEDFELYSRDCKTVLTSAMSLTADACGVYRITNAYDWDCFYFDVLAGRHNGFAGEFVELETDIAAWKPIGDYCSGGDTKKAFRGTFDGCGHTVTVAGAEGGNNKGVFSSVDGAVIRDLTVNGVLKGNWSVSGVAGHSYGSTFESCTNYAWIYGAYTDSASCYAGGIVGYAAPYTKIENCRNYGEINGEYDVGGIVGIMDNEVVVNNCVSYNLVRAFEKYAGGIAGVVNYNNGKACAMNCLNYAQTESADNFGGIAGLVNEGGTVYNCINYGSVIGSFHAGGIAGENNGEILNCCSGGYMNGISSGDFACTNTGRIENCYKADNTSVNAETFNKVIRNNTFDIEGISQWFYWTKNNGSYEFAPTYADYDTATNVVLTKQLPLSAVVNEYTGGSTIGTQNQETWYIVKNSITAQNRINISGHVHLIIPDGVTLNATSGICLNSGNTLSIHPQYAHTTRGTLIADASGVDKCAGIGGNDQYNGGVLNVYGCTVEAKGGSYAAGIGGGLQGNGGTANIYGGTVIAYAGHSGNGIGCGYGSGNGGTVNIYGGAVTSYGNGGAFASPPNIHTVPCFYDTVIMYEMPDNTTKTPIEHYDGQFNVFIDARQAQTVNKHVYKSTVAGKETSTVFETGEVIPGWHTYYVCSCGHYFTSYNAQIGELSGEIKDFEYWKTHEGKKTSDDYHTLTFDGANTVRYVDDGKCLPIEHIPRPRSLYDGKLSLGWQYEKGGETYFFNETVPVTEDLTLTYCQMSTEEISNYPDKKEITTSDKESLTSLSGIYTVSTGSDIVIDNRCVVKGFAVIILPDGCNITFAKGIELPEYRNLFIITPDGAKGTGRLSATGKSRGAGIGGCVDSSDDDDRNGGTVNIYGGTVTAIGGGSAAGIGGGMWGNGGTVNIFGGTVTATGGEEGAGIGGGLQGNGGTVNIFGGTVTATGGEDAAGIGGGKSAGSSTLTISGGVVRAEGKTAFSGDVTLRSNMTAYDTTGGEENASVTEAYTSVKKILVMPTPYDYLAVERNAYIDTGYKPTDNTRVVMDVNVKGGREYWFGVWDIDYNKSVFAFGNDKHGIYTGYGDEGGTYGQVVSNGYHTVELDKNLVKVDSNLINTHKATEFQLNNTLYLFAQNRAGEAMVYADQSAVIHCYGCEIYEGDTLVRKFVPGKSSSFESGLWDVVNGVFYDNQYESKTAYAGMTVQNDNNVETVSEVPATCTENGHIVYYKRGFKCYSDAECTKGIADLSVWLSTPVANGGGMISATGNHTWIEAEKNNAGTSTLKTAANCTDDAVYYKVCSVCDEISTTETWTKSDTAKGHTWEYLDGTKHKCSVCKAEEAHTDDGTGKCSVCTGEIFTENTFDGNGTKESPYLIKSFDDLTKLQRLVNSGYGFEGTYFKLTADIEEPLTQSIGVWNDKPFKGVFDGDGHSITFTNTENTGNKGLFGYTVGAKISNLKVYGNVEGNWTLGGIVGCAKNTEITNCENHAAILWNENGSESYAGGIVGVSEGGNVIFDCKNFATVSGNHCVGGIIGEARENDIIKNCINSASVTGNGNNVGGIVGNGKNDDTVLNCINEGDVSGKNYIGGIVGHTDGNQVVIENCINYGNITATTGGNNPGGIVGQMYSGGTVKNCFTAGEVSNVGDCGIIVGWAGSNNFYLENCAYFILEANDGMEAVRNRNTEFASEVMAVETENDADMIAAMNENVEQNDGWYYWTVENEKVWLVAEKPEPACTHENTEIVYEWNDDYTACTATKHCNDCNTDILTENATEIKLVEDTPGANCQTMGKGHYEATFETLGTAKTAENGVDTTKGEHHYIDYICEYCDGELSLDVAQKDAIKTIDNTVDHSDDEVIILLAETAKDAINEFREEYNTVADVLKIRDLTVSQIDAIKEINTAAGGNPSRKVQAIVNVAKEDISSAETVENVESICNECIADIEKLTGGAHEHTFSDVWSRSETHHWHEATCLHTDLVSGFGAHTFDENNKCTVCGYVDTGIRAKVCTIILTSINEPEKVLYSGTTDGANLCNIGKVENGTYLMSVSCEGAVTRTYTTEVEDGEVKQEVELYADGDVNGDGVVDVNDYSAAVNTALGGETEVKKDLTETDDYQKAVADFDKDGFVDVIDLALFERKIF